MFKKMKLAGLMLVGLLLMFTAVACTGKTVPEETAGQPPAPALAQTVRQSKNSSTLKHAAQTAVPENEAGAVVEMVEGVDWFTLAAGILGLDEEAMWDALMAGQSIADLAQTNGVDPQAIVDALAVAEAKWINELVAAGELEQVEADEWLAETAVYAQEFVEDNSWALWEGADWFAIAQETIGVDEETLFAADSIAAAAQTNGVDPQTVIDAIVAAETEWINGLVTTGELEQIEADDWLAESKQFVREFVEESWLIMDFEGADWFAIAQEAIGVDEETLFAADSIAAAAQVNGVDPQTVIDAIVAAETAWINELVTTGKMEQAEADEWLAEIAADAAAFVNESWAMWEGVDWLGITQEILGVDEDALWNAMDNGQSVAELAKAQGVDPQTIAQAIATAEKEWLTQMVTDGELTQAEADEWLAELDSEIQFFLTDKWEYEMETSPPSES